MGLEDVLKAGQNYNFVSATLQNLKRDFTHPANLMNFLGYTSQAGEALPHEELALMQKELSRNPFKLRQLVENSQQAEEKYFIETVAKDYDATINAITNKNLVGLAMQIPDKKKKFYDVAKKIEEGDYKGVQKAYAETFDNRVWKEFVELSDVDFLQEYANRYVQIQQSKFIEKNFGYEEDNKLKINYGKIKDYIGDTINTYKKKADRNQAYLMVGLTYVGYELQKKSEEAEKAKKNKGGKGKEK